MNAAMIEIEKRQQHYMLEQRRRHLQSQINELVREHNLNTINVEEVQKKLEEVKKKNEEKRKSILQKKEEIEWDIRELRLLIERRKSVLDYARCPYCGCHFTEFDKERIKEEINQFSEKLIKIKAEKKLLEELEKELEGEENEIKLLIEYLKELEQIENELRTLL